MKHFVILILLTLSASTYGQTIDAYFENDELVVTIDTLDQNKTHRVEMLTATVYEILGHLPDTVAYFDDPGLDSFEIRVRVFEKVLPNNLYWYYTNTVSVKKDQLLPPDPTQLIEPTFENNVVTSEPGFVYVIDGIGQLLYFKGTGGELQIPGSVYVPGFNYVFFVSPEQQQSWAVYKN